MPKRLSLEEQIQSSHFTLTDIQQKALQEYDSIKKKHQGADVTLEDQIEISKMLDAKMKMVIDATGKQIELLKVHERALRPSEGESEVSSSAPKNIPHDDLMKKIREEIGKTEDEYES